MAYKHYALTLFLGLVTWFATGKPVAACPDSLFLDHRPILDSLYHNQHVYNTLAMRTKLTWDDGKTAQQFQGTFRLRMDTLIWGSMGLAGFEASRILVTPDSFFMANKLNGEYLESDVTAMQNWLLFPLSFNMLQQVLTGGPVAIQEKAAKAMVEDSSLVVYAESDRLWQKLWINPQNYTLRKLLLKDKMLKQEMAITFDGYNVFNGKPFSYKRQVEIKREATTIQLLMDVVRFSLNDTLDFPFEKPTRSKKE